MEGMINFLYLNYIISRNAMNLLRRSRHKYGAGLSDMQILNNKYLKYVQPLHLEDSDEVVWEYTLTQSKVTDAIAVHIGSHILSLSKLHLLKVCFLFSSYYNFFLRLLLVCTAVCPSNIYGSHMAIRTACIFQLVNQTLKVVWVTPVKVSITNHLRLNTYMKSGSTSKIYILSLIIQPKRKKGDQAYGNWNTNWILI